MDIASNMVITSIFQCFVTWHIFVNQMEIRAFAKYVDALEPLYIPLHCNTS